MYLDLMVFLVIPLLIPLGFLFATGALILRLRALCRASDPCARNFWRCSVVAHLLFAYAVLVLTLLAADNLLGLPWQVAQWWPSLARRAGMAGEEQFVLLVDVAGALAAALVALATARCFGYVDESNVWRPPLRLVRRRQAGKMNSGGRADPV